MASKLRIVHCFRSPVGGIFRHVRDLTDAQMAAGHSVGIVCDSTTGGEYEEQLFDQMRDKLALGVQRTPMQRHIGPGDLASAWRSYRIIKELQPDVIHGHGAKGGAYARLFGSLLRVSRSRVARLYSPHGGSLHYDENTLTGKLFFALERNMARFTDCLLFVSDYERRTYRRKVGEPPIPNVLVYNGLRATEFEPVPAAVDAADLLYIGMMRDLKGPDLFGGVYMSRSRLAAWRAGAPDPIRWIVISTHGIPDWASEGEVRTARVPFRVTDAAAEIAAASIHARRLRPVARLVTFMVPPSVRSEE